MAKDWEFKSRKALQELAYSKLYTKSKQELIGMIMDLRTEVRKLKEKFDQKDIKEYTKPLPIEKKYQQNWSFATKIVFLLGDAQKPLTSLQIHKLLMRIDSHYPDYDFPKSNLSVILGRANKSKRISRIKKPGIKELYFALPEWMDEKGVLKEEFQKPLSQVR